MVAVLPKCGPHTYQFSLYLTHAMKSSFPVSFLVLPELLTRGDIVFMTFKMTCNLFAVVF